VALKNLLSWMNELRDCSRSTFGNTDSFYALRSHLHTLNYGGQPELMTVTLASSSFVNKKAGNVFCDQCKCIMRSGAINSTPDTDLTQEFDKKWNNVAVCKYNVRQESEQCNEGEQCSEGDWIVCAVLDLHSIYPHNRLCASPECNGVGSAHGRAPLMKWTDVYTV
jgi:hypothetical protein